MSDSIIYLTFPRCPSSSSSFGISDFLSSTSRKWPSSPVFAKLTIESDIRSKPFDTDYVADCIAACAVADATPRSHRSRDLCLLTTVFHDGHIRGQARLVILAAPITQLRILVFKVPTVLTDQRRRGRAGHRTGVHLRYHQAPAGLAVGVVGVRAIPRALVRCNTKWTLKRVELCIPNRKRW